MLHWPPTYRVLPAHFQLFFFLSWLKEVLADASAVHFPGEESATLGRTVAAEHLDFGEAAVWASVRKHYIAAHDQVLTDCMLHWRWSPELRVQRGFGGGGEGEWGWKGADRGSK